MRRFSSALVAVLGSLGLFGCGTSAYPSMLRVSVEDPANLLGPGATRISVFDANSGDTRDWALKSLGEASPEKPLVAEVASVETRAGQGGKPAREVFAGIYLPDYRELGWYELKFEPADGQQTPLELRFIGWDGYGPQAVGVPPLSALVRAKAEGKRWDLEVTLTLGAELPDKTRAAVSTDALTLELVAAAGEGNLDEVKRLLLKGAPINGGDAQGRTALNAAARGGHLEVVRYLAQFGGNVNLKDASGLSAFLISTSEVGPASDLLVVMLNSSAKLEAIDGEGNTGLIRAARRGHADIARRLLTNGAEVDATNTAGRTALFEVVLAGSCTAEFVDTVDVLLRAGADANLKAPDGRAPLDIARANGCQPLVSAIQAASGR